MVVNRVGPALAQPYWDEHLIAQNMPQVSSPAAPGTASADAEKYRQWIARLENVVRWQPSHVRAHLALAGAHRQLFETLQLGADNPMSMANIRDAAIQSHFPSREALTAWLSRAVGTHWVHLERALYHTRQALRLCPLEGRGYVYLADLSFLCGADANGQDKRASSRRCACGPARAPCCMPPEARPCWPATRPAGWSTPSWPFAPAADSNNS